MLTKDHLAALDLLRLAQSIEPARPVPGGGRLLFDAPGGYLESATMRAARVLSGGDAQEGRFVGSASFLGIPFYIAVDLCNAMLGSRGHMPELRRELLAIYEED